MAVSSKERAAAPGEPRSYSRALLALMRLPMILPYRSRLSVIGWLMAYVVAPLAGYDRRVRENLALVLPDLPEKEVRRLMRAVPANTGRMLMETESAEDFKNQLADVELTGPGLAAIDAARAEGRPIVALSGHFGNPQAIRVLLLQRGYQMGVLYRPVNDPALEQAFGAHLAKIGEPVFPRGRRGLAQMVRFLRQGNTISILLDQYVNRGAPVTFFGQLAPTSLNAAEMALKYDALMVPMYGIRRGRSFEVIIEDPIPHSDPVTMTQAFNDSLEARVRADMDQWLWIHRRWKPERTARHRKRAAARTAP